MATTNTTSSGTIASQYSGLMRVNGMASGMDIDGMVSKLMKAESVPLDKMKQKQQILQWQRDDYRDMNTALKDFDTTIFDGIFMQSTFNKKTVISSNDSLVSASATNAANNMSVRIGVNHLAKAASWESVPGNFTYQAGSESKLQFAVTDPGGDPSKPRTVNITIAATDTVDDIIQKFNNSQLGVTMFKLADNTIVMSNNKTGTGASINAADSGTMDFMKSLGFADAGSNTVQTKDAGLDAEITFNGYTMAEKSNTFSINGISYTIKGVTATESPVNISTATDVDTIYNSVKAFVDKYNDVIKKVNDKISEKRNRDFQPLTDDQRAAMNDTQITQWEAKAKSGMLSNDAILSGGLSKMRQDFYSPVSGTNVTTGYTQLSQIGITTSSDYSENGKLVIDETKLRQAIQDNPLAIYQLFNSNGDTYETKGIAKRLRDTIADTSNQVTNIAGKSTYTNNQFDIGKQLTDIGKQITDFQSKLSDIENRYYTQFSRMEQAMEQANNQSGYISQMLGTGG